MAGRGPKRPTKNHHYNDIRVDSVVVTLRMRYFSMDGAVMDENAGYTTR